MAEEEKNIKEVGFTVDAGLIQRLGYELVGRAETAVSELIKNAYDADATVVDVDFIDSYQKGGTLVISDNGIGMTEDQLINGFMRISSADKIHNPVSERFKRTKAGRKGIGRFATQRLGTRLIIVTQTLEASHATKIVIEWSKYEIDIELSSIKFPIIYVEKEKEEGTTLIIEGLTERWTDTSIKRVYRYVLDLLQPEYLTPNSTSNLNSFPNSREYQKFKVRFHQTLNGEKITIAGKADDITKKALVYIEGYVDKSKCHYTIVSNKLKNSIQDKDYFPLPTNFVNIRGVHFKVYYFIYEPQYYNDIITKTELNDISKLAKKEGGIKLYRNGFRVLPYGEEGNDWLGLDKRYTGASGKTNIPWGNTNFFGFVQITDTEGYLFEETASREGLIENKALEDTTEFVKKILEIARKRISSEIFKIRKDEKEESPFDSKIDVLEEKITKQLTLLETIVSAPEKEKVLELKSKINEGFSVLKQQNQNLLDEMSMLRILAGIGLAIGVFTHEMRGLIGSVRGIISPIYNNIQDAKTKELLEELDASIANLVEYNASFERIISQNTRRDLKPISIIDTINAFCKSIQRDATKRGIEIKNEYFNHKSLVTLPMHESEWHTILLNLYTNARKAIKRANHKGEIYIVAGTYEGRIYVEFMDNGDGIKEEYRERIFDTFFTTSVPTSVGSIYDDLVGSGLGLKIIKDIIVSYRGDIFVDEPEAGYKTCFRIEINSATEQQLEEYGY